jgi:hypothetical protein
MWRRNEEGDCRRGMADEAVPLCGLKGRDGVGAYRRSNIKRMKI